MDQNIQKTEPFQFDNSYARLPERFYELIKTTPIPDPTTVSYTHLTLPTKP